MCFRLFLLASLLVSGNLLALDKPRPLMRDFIGINGHTVQFKPDLYAPVARLARDYHPLEWDVGDDTSFTTAFPLARNQVDWSEVYGSWRKAEFRIDACLMWDNVAPASWKNVDSDAAAYGEAFAKYFGPAGAALVESVEIGNEPGKYSDAEYRRLFKAMAEGLRRGDPRLRIATCAANLGTSGRYSKSVDCLAGMEALYDILNIHLYAEVEGWPTWRRSYPEDPKIQFLAHLNSVLTWRGEHAPQKELWLTEFGWDASTKPAPATGTFTKWVGNTETQQAQWIVRGWMILAALGVDRAYLFYFNDEDAPQVHGSSGLTRQFQPKPSYYAAAWLQRSLGDYRFARVMRDDPAECYVYEFRHLDGQRRIIAVWRPNGEESATTISCRGTEIEKCERMPLVEGVAERMSFASEGSEKVQLDVGGSPVFLWLK